MGLTRIGRPLHRQTHAILRLGYHRSALLPTAMTDTALLAAPPTSNLPLTQWDIFCKVIDNFGDIGVCWRLASALAARGVRVRLRIDDASALQWMAPTPHAHIQVLPYDAAYEDHPQVVIEAFGCEAPAPYLAALAQRQACIPRGQPSALLINLEYLSAEDYVERCHRLPSLIMSGPAQGLTRWFFYPGFTAQTGGLIREDNLVARQAAFDRQAWRTAHGVNIEDCAIALFCYEPPALPQLVTQLNTEHPALTTPCLLVTPGRPSAALRALPQASSLQTNYLPVRSQIAFDEMLWACDLNFVRGEDSLVRALWAGQAFVWHIYPQDDNAHHAKLDAFLDWLNAPASLRIAHHAWNGMSAPESFPLITPELLQSWRDCARQAQKKLQLQHDLITQLQQFAAEKS